MDVILDTNVYIALLRSQGRHIFSSNAFVELFTYLRRTKSNLIVPDPVFQEIVKAYSDLISTSVRKAQAEWTTLQRDAMSLIADCFLPNCDVEIEAFKKEFAAPELGFDVVVLDDYEKIALGDVVHRGVHRIRPANDQGEELRDVVIWLFALQHAKTKASKVAFITDDGHFRSPDGNSIHPDLLRDVHSNKVEILLYDSISGFVRDNSLEESKIGFEEIAPMVKDNEVANLVAQLYIRFGYDDVTVSDIRFGSGQKYKVDDDSFYVEVKYTALVEYSETSIVNQPTRFALSDFGFSSGETVKEQPLLSFAYNSLIQGGVLGAIPPYNSADPTFPKTVKNSYQAAINLTLSFRIVSGTSQSVELLGFAVGKNTKLAEVSVR